MVRAIFFHLRDKRRSSPGQRAGAARRPSSPRQMAAASSPSPNDSGCAAEPRPPPGGGARGGATSRSTGGRNTASGPVSHYREADRPEVAEPNLPGEPGLLGCPADPTVGYQPPRSPKLQRRQPPAEPRTHPKPKSEALAGTDAPLYALEQEPQSPSRTGRCSPNERPNRSALQAPRRLHIYRDASRCVSASQNPYLHTPTTFSIGGSFRRRADISRHKGRTSGPFPDWPVFRPLIGC